MSLNNLSEGETTTPATSEESVEAPDPSANRFVRLPGYVTLVRRAIRGMGSKSGSSTRAIVKYICAHYIVNKVKATVGIKQALRKMVAQKYVVQLRNRSYKLTNKGRRRRRRSKKTNKKSKRGRKGKKRGKKSPKKRGGKKGKGGKKRSKKRGKK